MELQLKIPIKEQIVSFNQFSNGDIVICYSSFYMKIIKLIGEDKYKTIQYIQILNKEGNLDKAVFKVVEIKKIYSLQ